MEFTLQTDLAVLPQAIEFNFDTLKTGLTAQLERYQGLLVTEDTLKEAKTDRAALNSLSKSVNDAKISVKKTYMAPYDMFEKQVKEILAIIEKPASAIDEQIKAFEESERQNKYKAIEHFYKTNIGALVDLVSIDAVLNPKWANKTVALTDVTQEMFRAICKAKNDIEIIRAMRLDFGQQIIDVYLRTQDMSAALAEKTRLEELAAKLKALEAERKAAAPAAPPPPPTEPEPEVPAQKQGEVIQFSSAATAATVPQELEARDFRVYVTPAQKAALARFLKDNGIKYGFIPVDNEGRIIPWNKSKTA
jgi:hypothetical protein